MLYPASPVVGDPLGEISAHVKFYSITLVGVKVGQDVLGHHEYLIHFLIASQMHWITSLCILPICVRCGYSAEESGFKELILL